VTRSHFYWDVATGPLLVCSFGVVLIVAAIVRRVLGIRPDPQIVVESLTLPDPARSEG